MNDTVSYRYLADGTKLSALTNVGGGLKYRGSFVYEATVEPVDWYDDMGNHITDSILWEILASISWDEGRISFDNPFAVDSIATEEPVLEEVLRPRLLAHGEHIEEPIDTSGANAWMVGAMHDEWFIKDHLGSVRAVVNLNDDFGNATDRILEVNDYLPFGTRIPTDLQSTANRHRFSGKEEQRFGSLDLALLDFGARYYDPGICRWTTMDPLAEKYYSFSPYIYCLGNPGNLVDPKGWDVWEINEEGRIINRIKDNSQDAFYLVKQNDNGEYERVYTEDEDGNKVYTCLIFEYGTVESQRSITFSPDNKSIDRYDVYKVRGDDEGTTLFEFFSEHITNTSNVEIGHAMTGVEGQKGLNFVTTSHQIGKESGLPLLFNSQLFNGYFIRSFNHSHPWTNYPSAADNKARDTINSVFKRRGWKQPSFSIYYSHNKQYFPY